MTHFTVSCAPWQADNCLLQPSNLFSSVLLYSSALRMRTDNGIVPLNLLHMAPAVTIDKGA